MSVIEAIFRRRTLTLILECHFADSTFTLAFLKLWDSSSTTGCQCFAPKSVCGLCSSFYLWSLSRSCELLVVRALYNCMCGFHCTITVLINESCNLLITCLVAQFISAIM